MSKAARHVLILSKASKPSAIVHSLFDNAEKGIVVLPSLAKYFFQDAGMTVPAVAGMPVLKSVCPITGVVTTWTDVTMQRDAAGLLYLAFNGTSSYGVSAAIDFSGTDKMTVFAGVHKASDAAIAQVVGLNTAITVDGSFRVTAPSNNDLARYGFSTRGTSSEAFQGSSPYSYAAPRTDVLSCSLDNSKATSATAVLPRVNGAAMPSASDGITGTSAGNYSNAAIYFGMVGGTAAPLNGRIYGAIVRGATSTAGKIADVDREMARLTGVSF